MRQESCGVDGVPSRLIASLATVIAVPKRILCPATGMEAKIYLVTVTNEAVTNRLHKLVDLVLLEEPILGKALMLTQVEETTNVPPKVKDFCQSRQVREISV